MFISNSVGSITFVFIIFGAHARADLNIARKPLKANNSESSIACLPNDTRHVCKATFIRNASGTLRGGEISTGATTLKGRDLKYICYSGKVDRQQSQSCIW